MKYAEFVSPPMKALHQVLNFQEMSVPLFWESVGIAFICNVLPRGFLPGKPVPCVGRIGNLELITLLQLEMQLRVDDNMYVGRGTYLVETGCKSGPISTVP